MNDIHGWIFWGLAVLVVIVGSLGILWHFLMAACHDYDESQTPYESSEEPLVVCTHANNFDCCKGCPHSTPHNDKWQVDDDIGKMEVTCTGLSACKETEEIVRCKPTSMF